MATVGVKGLNHIQRAVLRNNTDGNNSCH